MEQEEEKQWVRRVQSGEIEVFERLVLRYEKPVFNIVYRYLENYHEAADVAQDVFISAYKSIQRFRGEARVSTWLYSIAVNQAKNRGLRLSTAQKRHVSGSNSDGREAVNENEVLSKLHDTYPDPEAVLEKKQQREQVQMGIQSLKAEEKVMIVLHDFQGLAYEEMTKVLNIPIGTVKSRLHRARQSLKKSLAPHYFTAKDKK